jgi:hypothetical protein
MSGARVFQVGLEHNPASYEAGVFCDDRSFAPTAKELSMCGYYILCISTVSQYKS